MKINNEDIRKITEIKQFMLEPPVSFKLKDYALTYLEDAKSILSKYPMAAETINYFSDLISRLQPGEPATEDLRKELKKAGIKIGQLTSR